MSQIFIDNKSQKISFKRSLKYIYAYIHNLYMCKLKIKAILGTN